MNYDFDFCRWPISGTEELRNLNDVIESGLWAGTQA